MTLSITLFSIVTLDNKTQHNEMQHRSKNVTLSIAIKNATLSITTQHNDTQQSNKNKTISIKTHSIALKMRHSA
jgi:hypothetical protein